MQYGSPFLPTMMLVVVSIAVVPACDTAVEKRERALAASSASAHRVETATRTDGLRDGRTALRFQSRQPSELRRCTFDNGRSGGLNTIFEIVGGGVAATDIDLDGQIDLLFSLGGTIDPQRQQVEGNGWHVLRNQGRWQMRAASSELCALARGRYLHGFVVADFDQDGFDDIAAYGWGGLWLWINQGDGTFSEMPEALLGPQPPWVTAAAAGDFDADGNLDVYLGSYVDWSFNNNPVCPDRLGRDDVCSPTAFRGHPNRVWLSDGRGAWRCGQSLFRHPTDGKTLGVVVGRWIESPWPQIYVANDLEPNFFMARDAETYADRGLLSGLAVDDTGVPNGSMGIAVADFDHDLREDLFVSNFEHEMMGLYLNRGGGLFDHSSRTGKLNFAENRAVGFGVLSEDWDGDGDFDVLVVCGHVHYHPDSGSMEQRPLLLVNDGQARFQRVQPADDFFRLPRVGRGAASADLDGDGDPDIIATQLLGPPQLIETHRPGDTCWLNVRPVGTLSPRTPVGTRIELDVGPFQQVRQLTSGGSYLSHAESVVRFTWLPQHQRSDALPVRLRVHWPSGRVSKHEFASWNRLVVVVEPGGSTPWGEE
ncbi:MAG: hypothetical protein KatS3mg111_3647 [Pirellulaceae bacterium]|nr:MAG: hypothetical protein KatS3mg111_3647 [Pirellulaceae bacterium]